MKLINPLDFTESFPIVMLVSHNNKFISWAIRWFSKGSYNHVCWLFDEDRIASQDLFYTEKRLAVYMKKGFKLKFYGLKNITGAQQILVQTAIQKKLNEPKINGLYDFWGILGQFLKLKFLNNPFRDYCSESVNEDLKIVYKFVYYKPSPAELNTFFKRNPQNFEYLGHWFKD